MVEERVASQVAARPAPVQRRGTMRVQAILDAADQVLAEEGYEASALGAIGKRAGIPTAPVYPCFADRNQVDAALIDPQPAYCREHPSMVELWYAPGRAPMLVELGESRGRAQASDFWRYPLGRERIAADTPELAVYVGYEAADRVFGVAFKNSRTGDEATIDEARRLMTAYFETYAPKRR